MLYIFKRFFFSFLSVFFFFFFVFWISSHKTMKTVKGSYGRYQYYVLYECLNLHDCTTLSKKKMLIFLFENYCQLIIQSGVVYIYIYRVLPWRCIEYFCSRFFWVENIHKPARQSSGNRLKTCLNLLKLVEGSSCFIF